MIYFRQERKSLGVLVDHVSELVQPAKDTTAQSDNSELRHGTSAGCEFIGNLDLSPAATGRQSWRAGSQSHT